MPAVAIRGARGRLVLAAALLVCVTGAALRSREGSLTDTDEKPSCAVTNRLATEDSDGGNLCVLTFLRALRNRDAREMYGQLSSSNMSCPGLEEYQTDVVERLEWTPYGEHIHKIEKRQDNSAVVYATAIIDGEGDLSLARIDFWIEREDSGWRIKKWTWGPSIDLCLPDNWTTILGL